MIVPIDSGREPPWADRVVDKLVLTSVSRWQGESVQTYREYPEKEDTDEDGKEDPDGPNIGIQTIEKADSNHSGKYHGLRKITSTTKRKLEEINLTVEYSYSAILYPSERGVVVRYVYVMIKYNETDCMDVSGLMSLEERWIVPVPPHQACRSQKISLRTKFVRDHIDKVQGRPLKHPHLHDS